MNINRDYLPVAEATWDLLFRSYAISEDFALSSDNASRVKNGRDKELSPYSHINTALLQVLTLLCNGNEEVADEIKYLLADNNETVEYNVPIAIQRVQERHDVYGDFALKLYRHDGTSVVDGTTIYGTLREAENARSLAEQPGDFKAVSIVDVSDPSNLVDEA